MNSPGTHVGSITHRGWGLAGIATVGLAGTEEVSAQVVQALSRSDGNCPQVSLEQPDAPDQAQVPNDLLAVTH